MIYQEPSNEGAGEVLRVGQLFLHEVVSDGVLHAPHAGRLVVRAEAKFRGHEELHAGFFGGVDEEELVVGGGGDGDAGDEDVDGGEGGDKGRGCGVGDCAWGGTFGGEVRRDGCLE